MRSVVDAKALFRAWHARTIISSLMLAALLMLAHISRTECFEMLFTEKKEESSTLNGSEDLVRSLCLMEVRFGERSNKVTMIRGERYHKNFLGGAGEPK